MKLNKMDFTKGIHRKGELDYKCKEFKCILDKPMAWSHTEDWNTKQNLSFYVDS